MTSARVEAPLAEVALGSGRSRTVLKTRLSSVGRPGAIVAVERAGDLPAVDPRDQRLPDVRQLAGPDDRAGRAGCRRARSAYSGERWTLKSRSFRKSAIWSCGCGSMTWPSPRLHRLEARVRVDDVAEDDPVELHRRADLEPRVLHERELHALLPALELPRPARDRNRVVEHLVHVLAADDVSGIDAA